MLPSRKRTRLEHFDYAENGAYFITICTKGMECILSRVTVGATCGRPHDVSLTEIGRIVDREISRLNSTYVSLRVNHYVIMPNHIHMLLTLDSEGGRTQFAPTISRAVKQFKGAVTKQVGTAVWQKGFHDHVIRDERDYGFHLQYIEENPEKWVLGKDEYYA